MSSNKNNTLPDAASKLPGGKKRTIVGTSSSPPTSTKRHKANFGALKSTPPLPVGKRFSTALRLLPCLEDSIFVAHLLRPNGDHAYMKPFRDMVNERPFKALDEFHIIALPYLRDPAHPEKNLSWPQSPTSTFGRLGIVCFRDNEESTDEFGNSFASKLMQYANDSDEFTGTRNKFIYEKNRGASLNPHPVNYYIRDRDTLLLLKKVYGGEGITKAELANDHDLLVKFFGDVKTGHKFLDPLDEEQWKNLAS